MVSQTVIYSEKEVLKELEAFVAKYPTKKQAADALGVNRVFLWNVQEGKSRLTESMLSKLGFKRKRLITYTYYKD